MPNILLVEDDLSSQLVVKAALSDPELNLTCASTLSEAKSLTDDGTLFDLILLDIRLPDGLGLELLGDWRRTNRHQATPVMLLTGDQDIDSKLEAFNLGAEDYLVKPINPRELKGRVDLRLRKSTQGKPAVEVLRKGQLTLNFPLLRATINEEGQEMPVDLTAKEFRLLAILAQHEGHTFTRQELVQEIWGRDTFVVARTVDSHICGARRKLGITGSYIQSVTGQGYRFMVKD